MEQKTPTSFTLSQKAKHLLDAIAKHLGISKTAAVEIMIRDRAKAERLSE